MDYENVKRKNDIENENEIEDGKKREDAQKRRTVLRTFSTIGFALLAIILIVDILQAILFMVVTRIGGDEAAKGSAVVLAQMAIQYFIGIPIGVWIFSSLPKKTIPKKDLSIKEMFVFFFISISFMYIGNIISIIFASGINWITKTELNNPVSSFLEENSVWVTVVLVVLMAPLVEEYLCRKLIIDRLIQYGEWVAIFTSAVLFGLFHRNLFQFFYAYLIGLVFGYIYVKTGKLRYTIVLHMIINFLGGVVSLLMLRLVGEDTIENLQKLSIVEMLQMSPHQLIGLFLMGLYSILLLGLALTGLILYFTNRKKIVLSEGEIPLSKKERYKIIFFNPGMFFLVGLCVATMILLMFA